MAETWGGRSVLRRHDFLIDAIPEEEGAKSCRLTQERRRIEHPRWRKASLLETWTDRQLIDGPDLGEASEGNWRPAATRRTPPRSRPLSAKCRWSHRLVLRRQDRTRWMAELGGNLGVGLDCAWACFTACRWLALCRIDEDAWRKGDVIAQSNELHQRNCIEVTASK